MTPTAKHKASHWHKLWALLDRHERLLAFRVLMIAALAALGSSLMVGSVMPFLTVLADPAAIQTSPWLAWAYDRFGFNSSYDFLRALGVGALVVIVTGISLQLVNIYNSSRFALMRIHSISRKLLSAYLSQPYEYYLNRNSSIMSTRVLSEVQELVSRVLLPTTDLVTSSLTIIALTALLMWVDPLITLAALGLFVTTYGFTFLISRMTLNALGHVRIARNTDRYRIALEAFGGIKEIKILGRESAYVERYSAPTEVMAASMVKSQIISQTPYYTIQAVALGGVILLCLALLRPNELSGNNALAALLPLLGVFAFAGQRMMPELGKLYQAVAKIQSTRASIDAIYSDLLDATENARSLRDSTEPLQPIHLHEELRFENVTYRYPEAESAGVTSVSFTVRSGEKIGIVGGTGAGKTTLADLILGLLNPTSGTISADGVEINRLNVRGWQKTVGYVPQDIFLGDSSVAENIALGIPPDQIDRKRIETAAQAAQIDAFIREELPKGYDTFVGERGVRLSGGQRQRIGIARALYHGAQLIVFDEATSALDNLTEAEVMTAIDALSSQMTVVMIAHRLSTVERCDRIIVMEHGRVVGFADWGTLMQSNAAFQRIARKARPE